MSAVAQAEQSRYAETAKDLIAGAAGGIAQVLIGERIFQIPKNHC